MYFLSRMIPEYPDHLYPLSFLELEFISVDSIISNQKGQKHNKAGGKNIEMAFSEA